ncbi:Clp protease ClpP [Dysgonomonas sp. GY75]|uniref:Clp protease ClpP n=1 Tax=Dysgonomonas sp. GY75 TaxID=2780419 RepID=UPI0018847A05|nr:Clp protease ClpP [Dysgonomonas sp. GY75]MBF0648675.1 Clp protease ClpP [Dysgonomonas sp. GY75]
MDIKDLKNVIGEAKAGEVATIRFFGKITEESALCFNNEFDYLETYVRPSLIRVLINSEGGSVLHGMSIYSTIQNSTIPTECIIEGMAASMSSIIWAAGNKSLMRDYSILMIHNPFLPSEGSEESDMVEAFRKQITTIYRKRFGLKKEQVAAIMDGAEGKDGTFFDARSAVEQGIIPAGNVLHTTKQLCEKVKNALAAIKSAAEIQALMEVINIEAPAVENENKHFSKPAPIHKQIHNNETDMTEENKKSTEYAAVAATLGMKDNFEVKDVVARITGLMSVEAKLGEKEKALADAQTVIAGKDAAIQNLQKDNATLNSTLEQYKKKEEDEITAKINSMIETAVTEGKIDNESKGQWVEMAKSNFGLAQNTLASIPAREVISKEIASDPENAKKAAEAVRTTEEIVAEKVSAVVGKDFEFKTLR